MSGINEEAHIEICFVQFISTRQHLAVHSEYQISNINIFLDAGAHVLVYTVVMHRYGI